MSRCNDEKQDATTVPDGSTGLSAPCDHCEPYCVSDDGTLCSDDCNRPGCAARYCGAGNACEDCWYSHRSTGIWQRHHPCPCKAHAPNYCERKARWLAYLASDKHAPNPECGVRIEYEDCPDCGVSRTTGCPGGCACGGADAALSETEWQSKFDDWMANPTASTLTDEEHRRAVLWRSAMLWFDAEERKAVTP
jgi:hypothetical protein